MPSSSEIEKAVEDLLFVKKKVLIVMRNFSFKFQFPPYATNETGRPGAVGRREFGHGKDILTAFKIINFSRATE